MTDGTPTKAEAGAPIPSGEGHEGQPEKKKSTRHTRRRNKRDADRLRTAEAKQAKAQSAEGMPETAAGEASSVAGTSTTPSGQDQAQQGDDAPRGRNQGPKGNGQDRGAGGSSATSKGTEEPKGIKSKKGKLAAKKIQEKEAAANRERSPIRSPSRASGGVPEPTAAYLEQATRNLQTLKLDPTAAAKSAARPLLVVIDLNGTLLYRPRRRSAPKEFVPRPHAAQFLRYCVETFWVVVWSSATPKNVESMCRQLLLPQHREKVVAIWGRDKFGLSEKDYFQRVQCYKRLSKLWADPLVAASYPKDTTSTDGGPAAAACWSQSNTILIDDSSEKARSEPYNLIQIPEFAGDQAEIPAVLPQVHDYVNSLCFQPDVSAYMKEHPFRATFTGSNGQ